MHETLYYSLITKKIPEKNDLQRCFGRMFIGTSCYGSVLTRNHIKVAHSLKGRTSQMRYNSALTKRDKVQDLKKQARIKSCRSRQWH